MAKTTKAGANSRPLVKRPKEAELLRDYDPFDEYMSMLYNAVEVERTDGARIDPRAVQMLKRKLFYLNCVGYDKPRDIWAGVNGQGLDDYGYPQTLTMRMENGYSWTAKPSWDDNPDGSYIIFGMPSPMSIAQIVWTYSKDIAATDVAIRQNREACKTPWFAVVRDDDTKLSVLQAARQKQEGVPAIVVSSDIVDGLKGVNFETPFLVDKFREHRDALENRLLLRMGELSANVNKRERVQVGEVNAQIGQAIDWIGTLLNNVNNQFEAYGIPYRLNNNTSTPELYGDEADSQTGYGVEYGDEEAEQ